MSIKSWTSVGAPVAADEPEVVLDHGLRNK
mgnify:CR=1 FL=1